MFPCRRKKVTGILLLIVISGSLFSACQFAYKDAKNKKAFSPYILASRFATYTPFFNLNYFALAAKEHQRLLNCKHGAVFSIISQGYRY